MGRDPLTGSLAFGSRRNDITFQRTRTWKESTDPDKDAKLDRIEEVTTRFPDRCFAFDQFGPLSIRPHHGNRLAPATRPDRLPATNKRTHGIRYFHGCYSLGDDQLYAANAPASAANVNNAGAGPRRPGPLEVSPSCRNAPSLKRIFRSKL